MIAYRSIRSENTNPDTYKSYGVIAVSSSNSAVTREYLGRCCNMFANNTEFNVNVRIGNNVTECQKMFYGCSNLNQPIVISDSVNNCTDMFYNCISLNQPIIISNAYNCEGMFYNCINLNQPMIIPSRAATLINMFAGCISLSDIYIKGTVARTLLTYGLVRNNNSAIRLNRINVHFNQILNNKFNNTNTGSLVYAPITWTAMTNGFYNTSYNVYCYYNYPG